MKIPSLFGLVANKFSSSWPFCIGPQVLHLDYKSGYLFVYLDSSKRGVPYRREYVNDHVKRCVNRSGINKPFHTHLARHTMASLVAEHCSWEVLKDRLGHTDQTTSKIYRHLTSNEKVKPLIAFSSLES